MELLKEMKEKYGMVPVKEPTEGDMIYWENWYENDYTKDELGKRNTAKNFIYWLDGLRISDWRIEGEETKEIKELKVIMGSRLMELLEIGYDFELDMFRCYLLATEETIELIEQITLQSKDLYPQELRFRLMFQTKGDKQKVLREQIEKYITKILIDKGFKKFLLEELADKLKIENDSNK